MIKTFLTGVAVAAVVMVADWATAAPLSLSHQAYSRADQMAPVEPQTEQGYETPSQFRRKAFGAGVPEMQNRAPMEWLGHGNRSARL